MTEQYLDITKSVMISSPAGSGKTEKLSRRYIELLKSGSEVERILAITFTDKAAAEMKERILNILRREDPGLFEKVRGKMPRMRISTIHAFCLKLLKRFCLELEMDPSLEVMDGFNADIVWNEAIYESLLEDGVSGRKLFNEVIKESGIKGWNRLFSLLHELHAKSQYIESAISDRENSAGSRQTAEIAADTENHFGKILSIYSQCLQKYKAKKLERHCLDYNDLELLAYNAISMNPEWQNVLYSFDEHTDHILVDEFQDTSTLQWKIIDKLTEEWRSGLGAKREDGMRPTIFLVGDDKQSIYSFRGANVSIFRNARNRLFEWLGDEHHFIEVKENYRSLPAIVDFVNALFERLMPRGLYDDIKVQYTPFEATRQGEGRVDLLLLESFGNTKENRKAEAAVIVNRIKELSGVYEINDSNGDNRLCGYGDMAILVRNRTYLSVFEDALRKEGIPFVVLKGIGFYNTPEVGFVRDLLFFLIDPLDDYSLFNILRSPLFFIPYSTILGIIGDRVVDDLPLGYLYKLLNASQHVAEKKQASLFEPLLSDADKAVNKAIASINRWLERSKDTPYAMLIEEILSETGAWRHFHEKQRYVNVKKFIKLVEESERSGLTAQEIRQKLIKASGKSDEAKANVNTAGMNAVQIMTVHASKGLQFPVVFLPSLDEGGRSKSSGSVVIEEDENGVVIAYDDDLASRKKSPVFQREQEKAQDEEKRLFYVAVTRAMDYLCMSGMWKDGSATGKLSYMADSFNLTGPDSEADLPFNVEKINTGSAIARSTSGEAILKSEIPGSTRHDTPAIAPDEMIFIEPLDYKPSAIWLDVTEETDDIRKKHGEDWIVLGRAFHRIFEGISKGIISLDNLKEKTVAVLRNEVLSDSSLYSMMNIILSDMGRLLETDYARDIILPRENAYAELPFVLDTGGSIYKGRIDRVIIKEGQGSRFKGQEERIAYIYDYKTYPIAESEIEELTRKYSFQMDVYKKAVERLFPVKAQSYIFFTHELRLVLAD